MHLERRWMVLWAIALVIVTGWCHAQSAGSETPEDVYKQLIHVDDNIQPLSEHPFGEQINLYDGTLSFEEMDVNLPGTGPTLQLLRSFTFSDIPPYSLYVGRPFGDWDLDIPRIETATANQSNDTGWQVFAGPNRCSNFGPPPWVGPSQPGADSWPSGWWWTGYHLIIPGQGSQALLGHNPDDPTGGQTHPIVTKQHWVLDCGVSADDGNEGFLATAPNGTKYTFSHLVYRPMPAMHMPLGTSPAVASVGPQPMVSSDDILYQRDALMYVTKIEDRFGNTLTYNYSSSTGELTSIVASDGRKLTLAYQSGSPLVQSVTVQASNGTSRTWSYSYDTTATTPLLTRVQLPDGSAWAFDLGSFQNAALITVGGSCQGNTLAQVSGHSPTGSITTPSGLKGTFTTKPMVHGRSYVFKDCFGGSYTSLYPYAVSPPAEYVQSLTSEVIAGAGVPAETWTYTYSPVQWSWSSDSCASTNSCPSTVYTDVTGPSGDDVRYTFSNRFDASEGQLIRTDYYSGVAGSPITRSVANSYANPTGGPWPSLYGNDPLDRDNIQQMQELSPLSKRVITQSGDTYTWQAETFNAFEQVTKAKRFSSISGEPSIEGTTTYLNDLTKRVLGLPETVTNVGTGEVESSNTYNSLDELTARARFGQTLMHYTWNSAGQLASFTDGDSHTTTLGSYVRGIPTVIGYPDGTSESLAVDDLGQITAITDQAGHTTNYSYDAIGRIARITYPYDSGVDSASWYPKTFSYSYVTSAERGVAAGHWRRTTTQGAATDTTYFDAELRPVLDDSSDGSADISTATGYDWRGLATFASYPVSGSPALSSITTGAHSTYDALGRLTQTQQDSELGMLTTSMAYLSGARRQVTDPKGNVTTMTYQVFDQPAYGTVLKVQAPTGITQTTTRDVYGNPLSITQSGNYGTESDSFTKTLIYDSYHRLCRSTTEVVTGSPTLGYSTVMAYDGANNLAWSADGLSITGTGCGQDQVADAAKTTRTYDAMNRVLTLQPPSGTQSTTYTYNARGELTQTVSGISLWWTVYNSLGQPTGEALWLSGQNAWGIGYTYDAYDHLSAVSYPSDAQGTSESVSYAPDAWGRPTRVGNYATGVTYFPDGQLQGFTLASGTSYLAEENARHLTRNFTYGKSSTLTVSEDQAYDKNGNLSAVNDLVDGTRNKTFDYDALNRLISAQAPNLYGTETDAYDALNNLRQEVTGGIQFNLNPDANNRLTSMTVGTSPFATYQNDAAGNRTATVYQGTVNYRWDAKHQLMGVSRDGANLVGYAYDANGRRIEKIPADGTAPTYYFYNHAGQLMYQYAPGTATATNYVYLGTKLIGDSATTLSANGTPAQVVHSYYTDPQGSVLAKTDAQGNILARYDYQPYGSIASGAGPDGPGYTGHVDDPETALIYMQQRYYVPSEGRFLSPDPVGVTPGDVFSFNRYAYADNNPVNHVDPDGRCVDGLTCDQMVQSYGKWAAANPAQADKIGSAVGVPGVTAMLAATGAPEAVGMAGAIRTAIRYVGAKIAGAVVRRAAANEVGQVPGRAARTVRTTRSGETAVRITREDGSVKDISPDRVKEYVPNTHPNAPKGALQRVRFDNAQPGSKGFKRDPTPDELKTLKGLP